VAGDAHAEDRAVDCDRDQQPDLARVAVGRQAGEHGGCGLAVKARAPDLSPFIAGFFQHEHVAVGFIVMKRRRQYRRELGQYASRFVVGDALAGAVPGDADGQSRQRGKGCEAEHRLPAGARSARRHAEFLFLSGHQPGLP
jgi:hypothetical protein